MAKKAKRIICKCFWMGEAEYSLFRKEPYPSGLHIENEDGSPTHCKKCAQAAVEKDENSFIGFLYKSQSRAYAETIKGHLSREFREKGVTVIEACQVSPHINPAVISLNMFATTKANPSHLANSHAKGDMRNHDGRLWENIYPGEKGSVRKAFRNENEMKTAVQPLVTFLEEKIFPHEFFARNAASKHTYNQPINSQEEIKTLVREYKHLLSVDHINLFMKDETLTERQSLHIDGEGIGLVVIYVEKCGLDGYRFYYVESSHHRVEDYNTKIWIPKAAVKQLKVQQGDLLVFAPSLIHAGGDASPAECKHIKFSNYISPDLEKNDLNDWTDISFQFTLAHALFPSPISKGKGKVIPFLRDEEKHDTATFGDKRYESVVVDEAQFKKYIEDPGMTFKEKLDASMKDWMSKLEGKVVHRTRNRVKNN